MTRWDHSQSYDQPQSERSLEQQRALSEQVKLVHGQMPVAVASSLLIGLAIVWVLWPVVSHAFLLIWYGVMSLVSFTRLVVTQGVTRAGFEPPMARRYAWQYVISTTLTGIVWGTFIILMPDLNETLRLVITMLLVGMVGAAITSNAALIYAYTGFVTPIILPLATRSFLVGGQLWNLIGLCLLVYLIFLMITSWRLHSILRDSIYTRFEQEKLTNELEDVKGQLEDAVTRLARLSSIDELTGIANRRTFDAAIAREWLRAERYSKTIALLLIDIDYFKRYNDHYMHQAGDRALHKVATVIASHARRSADLAARYGGEEFTLILADTSLEDATAIAESLRADVEVLALEHKESECSDYITVSVGVAVANKPRTEDYSPLITAADRALYKAKESGRNRVEVDDFV